jgi:hypothetical protein
MLSGAGLAQGHAVGTHKEHGGPICQQGPRDVSPCRVQSEGQRKDHQKSVGPETHRARDEEEDGGQCFQPSEDQGMVAVTGWHGATDGLRDCVEALDGYDQAKREIENGERPTEFSIANGGPPAFLRVTFGHGSPSDLRAELVEPVQHHGDPHRGPFAGHLGH